MVVEPNDPKENPRPSANHPRPSEPVLSRPSGRVEGSKKGANKRGGKRPGAGAPRGNFNAMKTGAYSRQFALLGRLLAADPKIRPVLLAMGARADRKFKTANEIAAFLLTRWAEHVEAMAEAKYAPGGKKRRGKKAVLGEPEGTDRLSFELPVDDWDSITKAAARYERKAPRSEIHTPNQSDITHESPKPIIRHTRKPH